MHHDAPFFANPENWVAISIILFIVLIGGKIWGALSQILDDRGNTIRAELEEASRLRTEAEAMLRDAQARRDSALAEATQLLEGARAEAQRVAAAAAADAEASARRRERMAIDRIAAAEKAAVDEVRMAAAEIATTAAQHVIAETLGAETDGRLVEQAITQLPGALRAA